MPTNKHKPNDRRNISRIDIEEKGKKSATHGWQVRFKRKGKPKSQFFNDNKFGSEEQALEAAKLFRDAMETELAIGKITRGIGGSQSKSGIVGVNRTISKSKKPYGTYTYYDWQAQWTDEFGKRNTKRFSVSRWGEEEALRRAIEARQNGIAKSKTEDDPLFIEPEDKTAKIWRYMDFTKFVSMIENKGLFFPTADNLGDPFEGSFSTVNKKLRPLIYKHAHHFPDDAKIGELVKTLRTWVVINCWHMSEHESAGMWNLYAKTEEAICIQSSYSKLRGCLPNNVKIGLVRYVDYTQNWIPESNLLAPFMYKRKSFEHEKELRAVINLSTIDEMDLEFVTIDSKPPKGGIWQPIDLNTLIENVYVAPNAPKWFGELVQSVVKTYGLNKPVIKSSLEDEPIF